MDNLKVRCKVCNTELEGHPSKTVSCGCPNIVSIRANKNISAIDLSKVVMINSPQRATKKNVLTNDDMMWQESRRQRKIRKLDFEIR